MHTYFQQTAAQKFARFSFECPLSSKFLVLLQYFDGFQNHILNENNHKEIIQKIFEKKKIAGTVLFGSLLGVFQWEKVTENHNCWCRSSTFTLISPIFGKREKKKKGKSYTVYLKRLVLLIVRNHSKTYSKRL